MYHQKVGNAEKLREKNWFFCLSETRIRGSGSILGSVPKCHGSASRNTSRDRAHKLMADVAVLLRYWISFVSGIRSICSRINPHRYSRPTILASHVNGKTAESKLKLKVTLPSPTEKVIIICTVKAPNFDIDS